MTAEAESPRGVAARWTPKLTRKWCVVSSYFLEHCHRLHGPNEKPLSSTEVLLIIHLCDFKWDARAPFPTVGRLARRMSLSTRAVRDAMSRLEGRGLVEREPMQFGGPNRYHLEPLFKKLELMLDADEALPKDTSVRHDDAELQDMADYLLDVDEAAQ